MDGLTAYALAKKYTDKVGQDIISAGFKVQVEEDRNILNRQGREKVLYLLPKEYGSSQDGYDEFVYANNTWEWVGKTDVNLDYETLENKPQINGVALTGDRTLLELGTLNFRHTSQNPPKGTSELIEIPCIWYNYNDKTAFYLLNVDETQAPREYYYTWSRFNNRIVVSNEAVPEKSNNNIDYEYDAGDIWVQTEINSNEIKALYICVAKNRISVTYNKWYFKYTWALLSQGGSQIVSGVVNADGTITFTDSEGNSFTTSGSNLVTSGNEQISMGYDSGGFYFLFDDGQEEVNNGTD